MASDVAPSVYLIGRPSLDWLAIRRYLAAVDGLAWAERVEPEESPDAETLVELMGRLCYRSWAPGLNPNVTRVREDRGDYLRNIVASGHGSVLEHANYVFIFHNVSRVFTHELVRHRAGVAISQESLRYVRLTDLPFAHPDDIRAHPALREAADDLLRRLESFQSLVADELQLDDPGVSFGYKKRITSAARRYAPEGVATTIGWTANVRALRHVVALRTDPAAEAEIRSVFDQVAQIMSRELPELFSDFERGSDGSWRSPHPKV